MRKIVISVAAFTLAVLGLVTVTEGASVGGAGSVAVADAQQLPSDPVKCC